MKNSFRRRKKLSIGDPAITKAICDRISAMSPEELARAISYCPEGIERDPVYGPMTYEEALALFETEGGDNDLSKL